MLFVNITYSIIVSYSDICSPLLSASSVFKLIGDDCTTQTAAFGSGDTFDVVDPGLSGSTLEGRVGAFLQISEQARLDISYFNISGDDIDSANGGNIGFNYSW